MLSSLSGPIKFIINLRSTLKNQTYGISSNKLTDSNVTSALIRKQAFDNYIANRTNGNDCDNPKDEKLISDGTFQIIEEGQDAGKLRYDESTNNHQYMMKKDENYTSRLLQEKETKEQQGQTTQPSNSRQTEVTSSSSTTSSSSFSSYP